MKKLLIFTAVVEGLSGLVLFAYPPIVIRLLFASEIFGAGVLMSRTAGIILISLAVACWPDRNMLRAFFGMLTYSLLAMLYLISVGVNGGAGILLWPGVAAHAGLSLLLVRAWRKERQAAEANTKEIPAPNRPTLTPDVSKLKEKEAEMSTTNARS
jgi:hypothetical protein